MNEVDLSTWNKFDFMYHDITFTVYWLPKDFTAHYESKYGTLEYGLHMLYMMPKEYSESMLEGQYCYSIGRAFLATEKFLDNHTSFIDDTINKYVELKKDHNLEVKVLLEERREKKVLFKNKQISDSEWFDCCNRCREVQNRHRYNEDEYLYNAARFAADKFDGTSILYELLKDIYNKRKVIKK